MKVLTGDMNKKSLVLKTSILILLVFSSSFIPTLSTQVFAVQTANVTNNTTSTITVSTNHTKVTYFGIVSVSSLVNKKQPIPTNKTLTIPLQSDPVAAANWQKLLNSGKVPKGLIPVVPETPIKGKSNISNTHTQIQPQFVTNVPNSGFDGFSQNTTNWEYPPDVNIAVGPNNILETLNNEVGIWTKQGVYVTGFQVNSRLNFSNSDFPSDARSLYDSQSGRWFIELMDQKTSTEAIAVSQTADPTGNWFVTHFQLTDLCIDFPKIGTSADKFVLSLNVNPTHHCGNPISTHALIVDKNDLISGVSNPHLYDFTDSSNLNVTPAKTVSSTSTLFMASNDPRTYPLNGSKVTIYKVTGPAGNPVISENNTSTAASQLDPPQLVSQFGTTVPLSNNLVGHTAIDASWLNGKMWFAFTDACSPSGGGGRVFSCIHLFGYNTTMGTSTNDFEISSSNYNYSYPALTIDKLNAIDVVFNYVSSTSYPGLFVTGQTLYDNPNQVEPLVLLKASSNYDTTCRYGDDYGASLDPSNQLNAWVAGEYHHLTNNISLIQGTTCYGMTSSPAWSTFIGSVTPWSSLTPSISISPTSGPSGTVVNVSGAGYVPLSQITITFNSNTAATTTANSAGSFATSFTARTSSTGNYPVKATDSSNNSASTIFTITTGGGGGGSSCTPPSSGDWTVTSSCTLQNSAVASGNVIVPPNVVLTIPNGLVLTINFGSYHLLVQPGGQVFIQPNGKLSS